MLLTITLSIFFIGAWIVIHLRDIENNLKQISYTLERQVDLLEKQYERIDILLVGIQGQLADIKNKDLKWEIKADQD